MVILPWFFGRKGYLASESANPSQSVEVDLPAPPISTQPSTDEQEKFIISHNVDVGMVSILDPKTLEIQTITGFSTIPISI